MELSWVECRSLLALVQKKVADAAVALVVIDIITASVSLKQAQVTALAIELAIVLAKPDIVSQETLRAEGEK